jgi:membrane-associated phospholipid phosphatase
VNFLSSIDDRIYLLLNALAGHSALFDALVALATDNVLVKAAPICAAFLFAWSSSASADDRRRRRVILTATLIAACFSLAVSKTAGAMYFHPRPFVRSVPVYFLQGDKLVAAPVLEMRVPRVGQMADRVQSLQRRETNSNNLDSFPSDHAALFFAISLGIAFACRRAGLFALLWTGFVLVSRIISGMHSPLDVLAGLGIAAAFVLLMIAIARRWAKFPFDWIADWTIRHEGMAAAMLFFPLFEIANLFENIRGLVQLPRLHTVFGVVAALGLAGCSFDHRGGGGLILEPGWRPEVLASQGTGITSPDGLRWVGDTLLIADEGGSAIRTWRQGRGFTTIADSRSGIKTPEDLVADAQGTVYFTDDKAGGLRRTDRTGHTVLLDGPAQGLGVTEGIALAPSGRILVSDPAHHRIASIGKGGDVQTFLPPSSGIERAESLAFAPDGDL